MLTRDAVSVGTKGVVSILGATCKTHKPPGEVLLRPLHKSVGNPLNPAMRFLRYFFRLYLADVGHIVKNSTSLKKKMDAIRVLVRDLLVKVDVKDFSSAAGLVHSLASVQSHFRESLEMSAKRCFSSYSNISTSSILKVESSVE